MDFYFFHFSKIKQIGADRENDTHILDEGHVLYTYPLISQLGILCYKQTILFQLVESNHQSDNINKKTTSRGIKEKLPVEYVARVLKMQSTFILSSGLRSESRSAMKSRMIRASAGTVAAGRTRDPLIFAIDSFIHYNFLPISVDDYLLLESI